MDSRKKRSQRRRRRGRRRTVPILLVDTSAPGNLPVGFLYRGQCKIYFRCSFSQTFRARHGRWLVLYLLANLLSVGQWIDEFGGEKGSVRVYLKCDVSEEPELVFEYRQELSLPQRPLSLRSWRYCVGAIKIFGGGAVIQNGSGDTQREPLKRRDRQEPQYGSW